MEVNRTFLVTIFLLVTSCASAFAQLAWRGELKYSHYMNENEMLRFYENAYSPEKTITEMNKINIYLIRSMVDYPGINQ